MLPASHPISMSLFLVVLWLMTWTISHITLTSVITLSSSPCLIVFPVQRQLDGNYIIKTEIVQKRSLVGYKGDDWYPFIKITTSDPKSVPKVRDKYFLIIRGRWHRVDIILISDDYVCSTQANARIMVSSTALSRHMKVISYIPCGSWSTPRCWSIEFNHRMESRHSLSFG